MFIAAIKTSYFCTILLRAIINCSATITTLKLFYMPFHFSSNMSCVLVRTIKSAQFDLHKPITFTTWFIQSPSESATDQSVAIHLWLFCCFLVSLFFDTRIKKEPCHVSSAVSIGYKIYKLRKSLVVRLLGGLWTFCNRANFKFQIRLEHLFHFASIAKKMWNPLLKTQNKTTHWSVDTRWVDVRNFENDLMKIHQYLWLPLTLICSPPAAASIVSIVDSLLKTYTHHIFCENWTRREWEKSEKQIKQIERLEVMSRDRRRAK